MDATTRKKLEAIHARTPRYLFRAWNNTPPDSQNPGRLSGGHKDLNRTDAIVPLAFKSGSGRTSVYSLTKQELTDMAIAHLTGQCSPSTELSSWASSLAFALNTVAFAQLGGECSDEALDNIHVGVIDTKLLAKTNQIFYVPKLDFLSPGQFGYTHEYLAHGIIIGEAYKALPLRIFRELMKVGCGGPPLRADDQDEAIPICEEVIAGAREIGEQYGERFALPVTLAVLCRKKREAKFWRDGVPEDVLNLVSSQILDLEVPREWASDVANQDDAEFPEGYGDVEQFCRLMRALAVQASGSDRGQRKLSNVEGEMRLSTRRKRGSQQMDPDDESNNKKSDNGKQSSKSSKYNNAAQERAAKRVTARRRSDRIAELQSKHRVADEVMREEDEKAMKNMQRALKKLKVDMKTL